MPVTETAPCQGAHPGILLCCSYLPLFYPRCAVVTQFAQSDSFSGLVALLCKAALQACALEEGAWEGRWLWTGLCRALY